MNSPLDARSLCTLCGAQFRPWPCRDRCTCTSPHFPRSGTVGHVREREDDCSFCGYICGLLRIEAFVPSSDAYVPAHLTWELREADDSSNMVRSTTKRKVFYLKLEGFVKAHVQVLLQNEQYHPQEDSFFPLSIPSRKVDMDEVRKYLLDCSKNHARCSSFASHTRDIVDIFLIDLYQNCIRPATTSHQFAAVSYVRGKKPILELLRSNRDLLARANSLASPDLAPLIPCVLHDAMDIAKAAGFEFLWFDALCILQDDASTKHSQISQMDKVYRSAVLTLVAMSCHSAWDPLPGAQDDSRSHSLLDIKIRFPTGTSRDGQAQADTYLFRAYRPSLPAMLSSSPYETRAWTLQERIMSPRCLYFSRWQVFLHCQQSVWNEFPHLYLHRIGHVSGPVILPFKQVLDQSSNPIDAVSAESDQFLKQITPAELLESEEFPFTTMQSYSPVMDPEAEHLALPNVPQTSQRWWSFIVCYAELVESYTSRKLSFPADIVRALAGILDTLAAATRQSFFSGLPVLAMQFALLWSPTNVFRLRTVRRGHVGEYGNNSDAFPSWSWASCDGPVSYLSILPAPDRSENIRDHSPNIIFTATDFICRRLEITFKARKFDLTDPSVQPLDSWFLCRENITFMQCSYNQTRLADHNGFLLANLHDVAYAHSTSAPSSSNGGQEPSFSRQDSLIEIARSRSANFFRFPKATAAVGRATQTTIPVLGRVDSGRLIDVVHVMLARKRGISWERRAVGMFEASAWDALLRSRSSTTFVDIRLR